MAPLSLLTAIDATSHVHLVVGGNPLAAARCTRSIEVGAKAIIIAPASAPLHYTLQKRVEEGEVKWLQKTFDFQDALTLGREEVGRVVDAVFVTSNTKNPMTVEISDFCKLNRIAVNVADSPALCTFSLLSTHNDGPLQIGVTTNGRSCKLSSRIRREIASSLPSQLGAACVRLGTIRRRIQEEDKPSHMALAGELDEEDAAELTASFNRLVTEADLDAQKSRRMRWLSQICEYWPLRRLASITDEDVDAVMTSYTTTSAQSPMNSTLLDARMAKQGKIILAGSGPGHPDLLTRATYKAILSADVILADKLVPSGVLDLIPRRTPVHIARKFPGNAEQAQEELLETGLALLKENKIVLRLKQGDPYIYGRGGEEFEFYRRHGYLNAITVLPGVTSALSAPLFAGIPATQRAVSDQILICTGTGRRGSPTIPPEHVPTRTVVFLMALHRIAALVTDLTTSSSNDEVGSNESKARDQNRTLWPRSTPCAVVERASCPDQRIIRTTLEFVAAAVEEEGSRPPGLLVLGAACEVLHQNAKDRKWTTEDGFRGLHDFGIPGMEKLLAQTREQSEGNTGQSISI